MKKLLLATSILLLSIAIPLLSVASQIERVITTSPNDDGNGKMYYLDRHKLDCGASAIRSFKLYRPTKSTIAYAFKCGYKGMGRSTHKETRANDYGIGRMYYLDRHRVDCGSYALQSFRLIRPTKETVAYVYRCGTKRLNLITYHRTKRTAYGSGKVYFLDRQKKINCKESAITGFRLFRPTRKTIAYKYSCGSYIRI